MPAENNKVTQYAQPRYQSYWPWAGGLQPWKNDGPPKLLRESNRVRVTTNTANFGKLKRRQLPDNPFQRVVWDTIGAEYRRKTMFVYPNGTVAYNDHIGSSTYFGAGAEAFPERLPIGSSETIATQNKALYRLLDEASLNKGSLLVSSAEFGKTAEMIASIATRVANAGRALRKGNIRRFSAELGLKLAPSKISRERKMYKKLLKGADYSYARIGSKMVWTRRAPSSQPRSLEKRLNDWWTGKWLEYSYGLKPLLSDVDAQMRNLAEYMTDKSLDERVAKGSAKLQIRKTTVDYPDGPALKRTLVVDQRLRVKYRVIYRIDAQPDFITQFGMMNIPLVVWELIPFSFVIDWALPIGNWLESLRAYDGLTFIKGFKTTSIQSSLVHTVESTGKTVGSNPYRYYVGDTILGTNTLFSVDRVKLTEFPRPSFPTPKSPVSLSHAISAIALIHAVFRGR